MNTYQLAEDALLETSRIQRERLAAIQDRNGKMSDFNFAKTMGRHHMAIRYQKNGAAESDAARGWLEFAMGPFGDERDRILAVRYQQQSEQSYRFARQRMGIEPYPHALSDAMMRASRPTQAEQNPSYRASMADAGRGRLLP